MCDCGCTMSLVDEVIAVCDRYGCEERNLLPVLHDLQLSLGYISPEVMETVAERLNTTVSQVHGVTTFYSLFYTQPHGKHVVRLCDSTACHIEGSKAINQAITNALGVGPGETTEDGLFTLEVVSCMGLCGVAPAMMVNEDAYGNLTVDSVPSILARYREGN